MKRYFFLLHLTILSFNIFGQALLSNYIELKVEQYEEDNEKYIGVSPKIKDNLPGKEGKLINKYHRRFDYLLQNKTHFQGIYDKLYPDTNKINKLYIASISNDLNFVSYFTDFKKSLTSNAIQKSKFNKAELMTVASKFFYCDGLKPDSTIRSHICIALNGVTEAKWNKDYTLLEAFCFEAIFENYYVKDKIRNQFVDNFVTYIKEGEKKAKSTLNEPKVFLESVRIYSFKKMEQDKALLTTLLTYYNKVQQTLPFEIR